MDHCAINTLRKSYKLVSPIDYRRHGASCFRNGYNAKAAGYLAGYINSIHIFDHDYNKLFGKPPKTGIKN